MAGRWEEMAICAAVGVKRRRGARAAGSEVRHGDGAADLQLLLVAHREEEMLVCALLCRVAVQRGLRP